MKNKFKIDTGLVESIGLWFKFISFCISAAVIFTAIFAVPGNTDGFWGFIGKSATTVSGFIVPLLPRHRAHDANPVASTRTIIPAGNPDAASTATETNTANPADDPCSDAPTEAFMPPGVEPILPPPVKHEEIKDSHVEKIATALPPRTHSRANKHGKPVRFEKTKINGIPLYKTVIDLDDPETYLTVGLANNASEANSNYVTHGDETFESFCKRYHHFAMCANGTFFSKDDEKRVMGNLVADGQFRKYSPWENYGTTLGLRADNQPEMITARLDGKPPWDEYWFSITCGPRLLRDGEVSIQAADEGFKDSHVLTVGPRSALGFNRKKKQLIHATFLYGLSLEQEAKLMKALGCDEAMNLDGGASRALAHDGSIIMPANRPLTNVLVVYDAKNPAPPNIVSSWERFQDGERPRPFQH